MTIDHLCAIIITVVVSPIKMKRFNCRIQMSLASEATSWKKVSPVLLHRHLYLLHLHCRPPSPPSPLY